MKWEDLSFKERGELIKIGVRNKLHNIEDIKEAYHKFQDRGNENKISDEDYYKTMEKVAKENWQTWGYKSEDVALLHALNDNTYNYREYYNKYPNGQGNALNHWPDEFKTAYHPTFSDESIYSGKKSQYNPTGATGGHWEGQTYISEYPSNNSNYTTPTGHITEEKDKKNILYLTDFLQQQENNVPEFLKEWHPNEKIIDMLDKKSKFDKMIEEREERAKKGNLRFSGGNLFYPGGSIDNNEQYTYPIDVPYSPDNLLKYIERYPYDAGIFIGDPTIPKDQREYNINLPELTIVGDASRKAIEDEFKKSHNGLSQREWNNFEKARFQSLLNDKPLKLTNPEFDLLMGAKGLTNLGLPLLKTALKKGTKASAEFILKAPYAFGAVADRAAIRLGAQQGANYMGASTLAGGLTNAAVDSYFGSTGLNNLITSDFSNNSWDTNTANVAEAALGIMPLSTAMLKLPKRNFNLFKHKQNSINTQNLLKLTPIPNDSEILALEDRALTEKINAAASRFVEYHLRPDYKNRLKLAYNTHPEIMDNIPIDEFPHHINYKANLGIPGWYKDFSDPELLGLAHNLGPFQYIEISDKFRKNLDTAIPVIDHEVGHAATGLYFVDPYYNKINTLNNNMINSSSKKTKHRQAVINALKYNETIANRKQPLDILRSEGFSGDEEEFKKAIEYIEDLQRDQELQQRAYTVQQAMWDQFVDDPNNLIGLAAGQWNQLKQVLYNPEEFQQKALGIISPIIGVGAAGAISEKSNDVRYK